MAIKRLYVPEDKVRRHGRRARGPGRRRGGGRRARPGGDHGPGPPAVGRRPGSRTCWTRPRARGATRAPSGARPRRGRRRRRLPGVARPSWRARPTTPPIVCDEQFAPALPVLGYRDLDEARGPGQRHRVRAVRVDLDRRRRPGRRRGAAGSRPAPSSSTATAPRSWTTGPPSADGSSRATASSSGPRAWPPSPGPRRSSSSRRWHDGAARGAGCSTW